MPRLGIQAKSVVVGRGHEQEAPVATGPVDASVLNGLGSAAGAVAVKDYDAPGLTLGRRLEQALLAVGGKSVVTARGLPEDIRKILDRGAAFGKTSSRMPGRPCQCHANSALLWANNQDRCSIATGYALSTDGLWREHSWVVQPKKDGADPLNGRDWRPVETTEPRTAYFGYVLTRDEADEFCFYNV